MDTHMTTMHAGPGVAPTTAASSDRAPALPGPAALAAYIAAHSKMRESADIAQIAPALVRAQGAMENPPRNRSVQVRTQAGSYTFRYATLDKITDMIRHALVENGLCLLQPIVGTERGPALVTRLLHESGQWLECEVLLPALGNNPQAFGSAVTYVRRYSVCALLNIAADEDDDANRAAGNHYADAAPAAARAAAKGASKDRARAENAPPRATAASTNAPRSTPSHDAAAASATPACGFRRIQPAIPTETSHLFRAKPAGHSSDPSRVAVRVASGMIWPTVRRLRQALPWRRAACACSLLSARSGGRRARACPARRRRWWDCRCARASARRAPGW